MNRACGPGKRGGGRVLGAIVERAVVVTVTVTLLPGAAGFGVTVQFEPEGYPVQVKATVWFGPPPPPTLRVYVAGCPAETVCVDKEPEGGASVKSAPVPLRLTVCVLPAVLLLLSVTVSVPLRVPVVAGAKMTLMVQEPFALTLPPQVFV